jgi:hypothetical protein
MSQGRWQFLPRRWCRHADARDPPERGRRHRAAVDRLGHGARSAAVVPGHAGWSGGRDVVVGPGGVVRWWLVAGHVRRRGDEAVVMVVAAAEGRVRVGGVVALHGHGALELRALRVLPLPLVRVLVAPERLRRREVPAAVVALELATTAATCTGRRRSRRLPGRSGADGGSISVGDGGRRPVGRKVEAEETDGRRGARPACLCRRRRPGPHERELREGVDVRGAIRRLAGKAVGRLLRVLVAHSRRRVLAS